MYNGRAVEVCPSGFFSLEHRLTCQKCSQDCATCANFTNCTSCYPGKVLRNDRTCNSSCGLGWVRQSHSRRNKHRIRLHGLSAPSEGRLEVYHGGVYGSVCNTSFNMSAANVVCRELGFGLAASIFSLAGDPLMPIFFDEVHCRGDENSLFGCTVGRWNKHQCYHGQDVAIRCTGPDQRQRCVRSCGPGFFYNAMGNECSACHWKCLTCVEFKTCTSCNFNAYLNTRNECVDHCGEGRYRSSTGRCEKCHATCRTCQSGHLSNDRCTSCHGRRSLDNFTCSDACPKPQRRLPQTIRLADGGALYGRLEVLRLGVWETATMCDDGVSSRTKALEEGRVACRALGLGSFVSLLVHKTRAHTVGRKAPLRLDNLRCLGTEPNLFQCEEVSSESDSCDHTGDVWIECDGHRRVDWPRCVQHCPPSFFENITQAMCDHCHFSCATCSGNPGRCTSCKKGTFLNNATCVSSCGTGYFINTTNQTCGKCSPNCLQCKDGTRNDVCVRCPRQQLLAGGQCVESCPSGTAQISTICLADCPQSTYKKGNQCEKCPSSCATCKGTASESGVLCTSCRTGSSLDNEGRCVVFCPHGFQKTSVFNVSASEVRLIGLTANEGRLEVFHNGVWGTVCKYGWTFLNSRTACHNLGYFSGTHKLTSNLPHALSSPQDQPIWLDLVKCSLFDDSLKTCSHRGWGVHSCLHSDDVYLSCTTDVRPSECVSSCPRGTFSSPQRGQCEQCAGLCTDCLGTSTTCPRCVPGAYHLNNTCHTAAGCPKGTFLNRTSSSTELECLACDRSCAECRGAPTFCTLCPAGKYLQRGGCVADCGSDHFPESSRFRLVGGPSDSEGYVLVADNHGQFGYICDDKWSLDDGHVICRQLKLGRASAVFSESHYENVNESIPILLDDLECVRNESSIFDCPHGGIRVHNCDYDEIAAVRCTRSLPLLECKPTCDTGSGLFVKGRTCSHCDALCKMCSGERHNCTSCQDGMVRHGSICLKTCPDRFFERHDSKECIACDDSCGVCNGPLDSNCTDCLAKPGETIFLENSSCVPSCSGPNHYLLSIASISRQHLRLVGLNGISRTAGRVEVFDPISGQFGTVCDDYFGWNEARVVCRMLGLGKPMTIYMKDNSSDVYSNEDLKLAIFLDDLKCKGDERSLFDCEHIGLKIHNCERKENAGVKCNPYPIRSKQCKSGCGKGFVVTDKSTSPPTCEACPPRCESCDLSMNCTICKNGFFLLAGGCELSCPSHLFGNTRTRRCEQCAGHCGTCFNGPANDGCKTCNVARNLHMAMHNCTKSCPAGTSLIHSSLPRDKTSVRLSSLALKIGDSFVPICFPSSFNVSANRSIGVVACRQFGYAFKSYSGTDSSSYSVTTIIDKLHCTGKETNLMSCSRNIRSVDILFHFLHGCSVRSVICDRALPPFGGYLCTRTFPTTPCSAATRCHPQSGCFTTSSGGSACWPCPEPLLGNGQLCASKLLAAR